MNNSLSHLMFRTAVGGMLVLMIAISGCQKLFDVKPKDALDITQAYQNVYDADAAVIGIYGKFMKLADRYVLLNELRADLLDVTQNAGDDLRQLNTHRDYHA